MTEAFSQMPDGNSAEDLTSIQCHLCLREITYSKIDPTVKDSGFVGCNHCGYKQPVTKFPRTKDIAIFGVTVSAVYIATIIAVLIAR